MTATLSAPETTTAAPRALDATGARAELTAGLALVQHALPSKTALPVLRCIGVAPVMADLGAGRRRYLRLSATDLDLAIRTHVSAEVAGDEGQADDTDGAVLGGAIPGKRVIDLVRLLPPGAVRLHLSAAAAAPDRATHVQLAVGRTRHRYDALAADELPVFTPATEGGQRVPARAFRAHAKRVLYAVGQDDARPILQGAYLEADAGTFALTATSGHRLSSVTFPVEPAGGAALAARLILPPRFLDAVLKCFADDDTLTVYTNAGKSLTVTNGTTEITTRLIEGPYPNYRQVIPSPASVVATLDVDRAALIAVLRRAMLVSDGKTHRVRFTVRRDLGGATLAVEAMLDGVGEGDDALPCTFAFAADAGEADAATTATGEVFAIRFNAGYVVDALTHLWASTVRLSFTGLESAALVDCVAADAPAADAAEATDAADASVEPATPTEAGAALVTLIMPLRLDPVDAAA